MKYVNGFAAALLFGSAMVARADVRLSKVFSDGIVLQRDAQPIVWGWASAGEKISVAFAGKTASTEAAADGKWRVQLPSMSANDKPADLVIHGDQTATPITIHDVLVGDVWLCSGQSNMAFTMNNEAGTPYADDLKTADFPTIRQGYVAHLPSADEQSDVAVKWTACSPKTVGEFTAVGFYFARSIQRELHVPIGLVNSSWGGTSIDAWMSMKALSTQPTIQAIAEKQLDQLRASPAEVETFPQRLGAWEKKCDRVDDENRGEAQGWAKSDFDDSDWKSYTAGTTWEKTGAPGGGVFWLRKTVELPENAAGKSFGINFGSINMECETTYFNGVKIGASGKEPPLFYKRYCYHQVPGELVKAGKNVLAVRLVADGGWVNGLGASGKTMGFEAIGVKDVGREYQMKAERVFAPLTPAQVAERPPLPAADGSQVDTALFNGMIAPVAPYTIKGAIWYQGENNAGQPYDYRKLLPMLINDWRSRWGTDFPMFIVQLPNFAAGAPKNTNWAVMRDSQRAGAQAVEDAHVICTIDVGDSEIIHPKDKRTVGQRVALSALQHVYGKAIDASGPVMEKLSIEGDAARVTFQHAEGLKSSDGGPLKQFQIAGADQKFVAADAKLDGSSVIVSSPAVSQPVAVRYAWINDPVGANLVNAAGLPAFPFRTDDVPDASQRNSKLK